jgi:hypothetical protein
LIKQHWTTPCGMCESRQLIVRGFTQVVSLRVLLFSEEARYFAGLEVLASIQFINNMLN